MKLQALAILLVASTALAQDREGSAPRRTSRSGGQFPPFGMVIETDAGKWLLLQREPIIRELGLSDEAIEQLRDAYRQQKESVQAIPRPERADGESSVEDNLKFHEANRELIDRIQQVFLKRVSNILTPEQQTRLQEVYLQNLGVAAFAQQEIADKLQITKEQNTKIRQLLGLNGWGGRPDSENLGRMERTAKIMELLTEEQREQFQKMQGKRYDLSQLRPRRRDAESKEERPRETANPPAVRWDYKVVEDISVEELKKLGDEGWELVSVTPTKFAAWKQDEFNRGDDVVKEKFYFKRLKPAATE
jgi:Spy/CpxP family protein refolding chaperone